MSTLATEQNDFYASADNLKQVLRRWWEFDRSSHLDEGLAAQDSAALMADVKRAMKSLPDDERHAIFFNYVVGHNEWSTGWLMGLTGGQVNVLVNRGIKRMHGHLTRAAG